MMRIITGRARGVRLATLEGEATRPTAERTKEAVFSMLQNDLADRRVLDLFAGSGQMALEALSRGSGEATLVDRSPEAIRIIEQNAVKTKLREGCRIVQNDCMTFIRSLHGERFDLVFLDPPYAAGLIPGTLRGLYEAGALGPGCILVCESAAPEDVFGGDSNLAEIFKVTKINRYGKAVVTLLTVGRRNENEPGSDPREL